MTLLVLNQGGAPFVPRHYLVHIVMVIN